MPTIDKRNTVTKLYTNGSEVGLAVLLSLAEAVDIYGVGSVAGWYVFGTFDGGEIEHVVEQEKDRDESGELTGKVITLQDDFVLTNMIKETDDKTQELIEKYLSVSFHKYRYPLPAETTTVDIAGTPTVKPAHQVYGVENGLVDKGFKTGTAKGKRMRPFRLEASKQGATPSFVRKTVWLGDQATWPAELTPFRDPV